jgi:hypothetical protein
MHEGPLRTFEYGATISNERVYDLISKGATPRALEGLNAAKIGVRQQAEMLGLTPWDITQLHIRWGLVR